MKSNQKIALCLTGAIVLIALGIVAYRRSRVVWWPQFSESQVIAQGTPLSVVELRNERDYGYRTGNIVPVRVSLKVPAGTDVILDSVSLTPPSAYFQQMSLRNNMKNAMLAEKNSSPARTPKAGDKNHAGAQKKMASMNNAVQKMRGGAVQQNQVLTIARSESFVQEGEGGVKYIRLDLDLQSFTYMPRWVASVSIQYSTADSGKIQTLVTEPIEVFTVHTYDGRKSRHPMSPLIVLLHDNYHALVSAGYLLIGFTGMAGCCVYLFSIRRRKQRPATEVVALIDPWSEINKAWKVIAAGNHSKEEFDALALAVRVFFKLDGGCTVADLRGAGLPQNDHIATILQTCEDVTWGNELIDDARLQAVGQALHGLNPSI